MKKIILKVLSLLLIMLFIYAFLGKNSVEAASVSISAPGSVNEGESFNVILDYSSDAIGVDANITVKFADGSTQTKRVSYTNYDENTVLGSKTATFTAKGGGTATITASNIVVPGADGSSLSVNSTASATITVNSATPAPAPAPVPDPEPTPEPDNTPVQPATLAVSQPVKEPEFKSVNDKVYATKSMNVRSSWSTDSKKVGGLSEGEEVVRTGIGDNGWSRITYNGKTAYVSSSLITTTKPEEKPESDETKPDENDVQEPENVEDTEDTKELTEEAIYAKIVEEVGTIPEVGTNVNYYIFGVLCIISIISTYIIFRRAEK